MERSPQAGWVLYDGTCGFCTRWANFWSGTLKKHGFDIAPLQSDWVVERLKLPVKELEREIRLLPPDGGQVTGADVYRYVMKRVWWMWPFYLLSVLPLLRNIFDWGYRTVAANRHWFSSTCGLD